MNTLRKAIFWIALKYFNNTWIKRGSWRLLAVISGVFGCARYHRRGINLWLQPVSLLDRLLIMKVDPNPALTKAVESCRWESGYFLDVGANFGYFSLLAASRGARVIAFEPSPRELQRFHRNIVVSGLCNVTVFPIGLSDQEEKGRLALADIGNPGSNTMVSNDDENALSVSVLRLSDVLGRGILSRVKLVKLDVEGHEFRALLGLREVMDCLKEAQFIVEITPSFLQARGHNAQQIYDFFRAKGFRPTIQPQECFQWDEVFVYGTNVPS